MMVYLLIILVIIKVFNHFVKNRKFVTDTLIRLRNTSLSFIEKTMGIEFL